MEWKELKETKEEGYILVLETGDEVLSKIKEFVKERGLTSYRFEAIGAFERAVLGFYDLEKKDYKKNPVNEQVEVVSLIGNVTESDGETKVHTHAVLGKSDGTAYGGHLLEGHVKPTLEILVKPYGTKVVRHKDEKTGLPLIDLGAP